MLRLTLPRLQVSPTRRLSLLPSSLPRLASPWSANPSPPHTSTSAPLAPSQPTRHLHHSSTILRSLRSASGSRSFSPRPAGPTSPHKQAPTSPPPLSPQGHATKDQQQWTELNDILKLAAIEEAKQHEAIWAKQRIRQPTTLRAVLFLVLFGFGAYSAAATYSVAQTMQLATAVRNDQGLLAKVNSYVSERSGIAPSSVWGSGVNEGTLQAARKHEQAQRMGHRLLWLTGWCDQLGLPQGVKEFAGRSYVMIAESQLTLPQSKEVLLPILAFNTLIFTFWRLGPSQLRPGSFMSRHFLHRPSSGRHYTMLTSTFSHHGGLHFLFNNYALWSFGGSALIYASHVNLSSPRDAVVEASSRPHFLAFFATAGVFAAVVSHLATAVRFRRVAKLQGLERAKATVGRTASLGASGAVYAAVVATALSFPDNRVGLIFLPFFSVPIGMGVAGMVSLDLLGILLRWSQFDHFAHLGGALFGYIYFYYGPQAWEAFKVAVLRAMLEGARERSEKGRSEV